MNATMTALGLMSGTSMDGIDVAVLRTDGEHQSRLLYAKTFDYQSETRDLIKECIGLRDEADHRIALAERAVTQDHANACAEAITRFPEIDIIGFHGQTIWHAPREGLTRQLGYGQMLADMTRRQVIFDFRANDMKYGGQGAPLLPLYHAAKAKGLPRPIAIVNIGGVSNVTWIGSEENQIMSFDTGPGNALLNDWMENKTGLPLDKDGATASKGHIDYEWIEKHLKHPYFSAPAPKSLDRQAFGIRNLLDKWSLEDGAATLSMFTAASISLAGRLFPEQPAIWVICGGGRNNPVIMKHLRTLTRGADIVSAEDASWNGDSLEAEGFAYLAVRAAHKKFLTLPQTTGCSAPVTGGISVKPTMTGVA